VRAGDYEKDLFGNKVHNDVCGEIVYHRPSSGGNDAEQIGYMLSAINNNEFLVLRRELENFAIGWYVWYVEAIKTGPVQEPPVQKLIDIINVYDSNRGMSLMERNTIVRDNIRKIADIIIAEATSRSVTSTGDWFTAIRLEQSKIIAGGFNIPLATGPNEQILLTSYNGAFRKYEEFLTWLSKAPFPIGSVH
jgi:hypothetical protein